MLSSLVISFAPFLETGESTACADVELNWSLAVPAFRSGKYRNDFANANPGNAWLGRNHMILRECDKDGTYGIASSTKPPPYAEIASRGTCFDLIVGDVPW